jgi:hypothetical protein
VLGRADRGRSRADNHLHLEPDQLGRQLGQPFRLALGIPVLDDHVLSLDVAQGAQTLLEGLDIDVVRERAASIEQTDPVHFLRWLRVRGARRREEAASEGDETPHGAEPQPWPLTSAPGRPPIIMDMTDSGPHSTPFAA